jgi:hypothetical protein
MNWNMMIACLVPATYKQDPGRAGHWARNAAEKHYPHLSVGHHKLLEVFGSRLTVIGAVIICQAGNRFGPEQAVPVPGGSWHPVFHDGECLQMPKGTDPVIQMPEGTHPMTTSSNVTVG